MFNPTPPPNQTRSTLASLPFSALGTALIVAAAATLATWAAITYLGIYGYVLFMGVPFAVGVVTVLWYGRHTPRSIGASLAVASFTLFFTFLGMLLLGIEGAGCLIMAAPLWMACTLGGVCATWPFHRMLWNRASHGFPIAIIVVALTLPALFGAEKIADSPPALASVTTTLDIAAPPEIVWKNVIEFRDLPDPTDPIFKLGVAYPVRAEIIGSGVGAQRHCIFSTGPFVEPITTWDAPHLLAFDVSQNPPTMNEWSFYRQLHPPHLEGYFTSERGEFRLTALPNGSTRLQGTTWYRNHMNPQFYWQPWSDLIVHRIHQRVLTHIKTLSEQDAQKETRP